MPAHEISFVICSYLLGSIPFGFILYYLTEKKDIRSEGSGNIGAMNVMRTKGRFAGIATLLLDISKSAFPILYGMKHFDSPVTIMAGGAAAVLGHLFPVWIKFRGGKGIACFLGVLIAFNFNAALVFGAAFLSIIYITRIASAGSIAGVASVFLFILFTQVVEVSMMIFAIAGLIISRHHTNIKRIAKGCENKFKWNKNEQC